MRIITVSREFGSGGRELGKRMADVLGVAYYDKEIIAKIAERVKMDEGYIERVLDRSYTAQYPYTFRRSFAMMPPIYHRQPNLFAEQAKIIRELAEKEDCVIVGRAADVLLWEKKPFNIFVYADMTAKLERCRERASEQEQLTDREMVQMAKRIDKDRASNYALIADHAWGDKRAYHLCVNTAGVKIPELVPLVAAYAQMWFDNRDQG